MFDKLQKDSHPQIEALLGWLELLPEVVRCRLINGACRDFPYLEHPRLNHDPVQVSSLRSILNQPAGLTLVSGGNNEGLHTWLLTAIGHASLMLGPGHRLVTGIDCHLPDWFVPVDGVTYLNSPQTERPSADSIQEAWARCVKGGGDCDSERSRLVKAGTAARNFGFGQTAQCIRGGRRRRFKLDTCVHRWVTVNVSMSSSNRCEPLPSDRFRCENGAPGRI